MLRQDLFPFAHEVAFSKDSGQFIRPGTDEQAADMFLDEHVKRIAYWPFPGDDLWLGDRQHGDRRTEELVDSVVVDEQLFLRAGDPSGECGDLSDNLDRQGSLLVLEKTAAACH